MNKFKLQIARMKFYYHKKLRIHLIYFLIMIDLAIIGYSYMLWNNEWKYQQSLLGEAIVTRAVHVSPINTALADGDFKIPTLTKNPQTESKITYDRKTHKSHRYLTESEKTKVLGMIDDAGLSTTEAICLINHESGWDSEAMKVNKDANSTLDRGLWQINAYWHYEVNNACAMDIECSTKEAIRIRKANGNWNQWYGFKNNCK